MAVYLDDLPMPFDIALVAALDRQLVPDNSFHGSPLPRLVPYPSPVPHPLCLAADIAEKVAGQRLV